MDHFKARSKILPSTVYTVSLTFRQLHHKGNAWAKKDLRCLMRLFLGNNRNDYLPSAEYGPQLEESSVIPLNRLQHYYI